MNNQNNSYQRTNNDKTGNKNKNWMYQKRGFCKLKEECESRHSESICEEYLQDGKCLRKGCLERHPKECQYWIKCEAGCTRGNECMYLHVDEKQFKPVHGSFETEEHTNYSCDECNFKSENRSDVKYHMTTIHKDQLTEMVKEILGNKMENYGKQIQSLQKEIDTKEESRKELLLMITASDEKENISQKKISEMEEIIVDQNKKLNQANTCARNAVKEVKRLRIVTNESKQNTQKVLSKDT